MRTVGAYHGLLGALTLLGILYPLLSEGDVGYWIWSLAFWLSCLGALRACQGHRVPRRIAYAMFVALVVVGLTERLTSSHVALWVVLSLQLAFFAVVLRVILLDVLTGARVSTDTLFGAASFYILLGLAWAHLFLAIELAQPGSFSFSSAAAEPSERDQLREFLYLSFTTLSTLGYGDLVPLSGVARLVTTGEALIGQLYLTVLVARLVGLHISQAGEDEGERQDGDGGE